MRDRLASLRAARDALARRGVAPVAASSVYETEPQGEAVGQRDFLNACLAVETELDAEGLLDACKAVERELGREPGGRRHSPRPIDVDVLLLDPLGHSSERLTVPHPELHRRRFALEPLVELEPELRLPDGRSLAALLADVREQRVERVGPLPEA